MPTKITQSQYESDHEIEIEKGDLLIEPNTLQVWRVVWVSPMAVTLRPLDSSLAEKNLTQEQFLKEIRFERYRKIVEGKVL